MKRFTKVIFTAAATLCCASAMAMDVGTVDMQKVLSNSAQTSKVKAQLESQFSGRKAKLEAQQKALQADLAKFEKNKAVMSKTDLDKLKAKINDEGVQLRDARMSFQKSFMQAQEKLTSQLIDKLKVAIKQAAQKNKLTLVLPSTVVLYSQNETDLTSAVIKDLKS